MNTEKFAAFCRERRRELGLTHGDLGLLGGGTSAGAAGHCAGIVLGRRSKEKPQLTDEHKKDR